VLHRATRAPGRRPVVDLTLPRRRRAARLQDHMDGWAAALHARPLSRTLGAPPFVARWLLATVTCAPAALPRVDESERGVSPRPRRRRDLRRRCRPLKRTARSASRTDGDRVRRGHIPEPGAARAGRRGARGIPQSAALSD